MADSGLVDSAVMSRLANDAALKALCPDGVFYGLPPPACRAFVIVMLMDHEDRPGLGGVTLLERAVYLAKAVILSSSGTPAREAAARIHVLLDQAELDLAAAGYQPMACRRIERWRPAPEVDPVEKSARWQHVGGQYEVTCYPI